MDKIKIVFMGIFYPFAILSYFWRALDRRDDVELWTCGSFWNDKIPWKNGMTLEMRYVRPINLPFPPQMMFSTSWASVKNVLPWKPDLVLQVDAGGHFSDKPDCLTATVATDPHVLNYDLPHSYSDKFFNMQKCYSKPNDIWLPYAHDPTVHFPDTTVSIDSDASLIGLHYPMRDKLVETLRARGHKVIYEMGLVYDEYRQTNCRAKIGLNWSCLNDICARVVEVMGMCLIPVLNRVPDLPSMGLQDGTHYLGFDSLQEAVDKVEYALSHPVEAMLIAQTAHDKVIKEDTWDIRVNQVLKECGLI